MSSRQKMYKNMAKVDFSSEALEKTVSFMDALATGSRSFAPSATAQVRKERTYETLPAIKETERRLRESVTEQKDKQASAKTMRVTKKKSKGNMKRGGSIAHPGAENDPSENH